MGSRSGRTSLPLAVQVVVTLAFALVGCFPFSVAYHVSVQGGRAVGAAYGWSGQEGTLTVTGEKKRYSNGRTAGRRCLGTFAPADGGPARTGLDLHVSDCEVGRTSSARFVPESDGWLRNERAAAYDATGAGAGGYIVAIVLVDLFCGVVGLVCAAFAWGFGRELVKR